MRFCLFSDTSKNFFHGGVGREPSVNYLMSIRTCPTCFYRKVNIIPVKHLYNGVCNNKYCFIRTLAYRAWLIITVFIGSSGISFNEDVELSSITTSSDLAFLHMKPSSWNKLIG